MSNWWPFGWNKYKSPANTSQQNIQNGQKRKRSPSPTSDIQLLDSSNKKNRNYLIDDPGAISFFAELGLNQKFLNSGNVLAWSLQLGDPDFFRIHKYVERSQGWQSGIKVLNILRVLPNAKSLETSSSSTSVDFEDDPEAAGRLRTMLWHGTKTSYLQSILENGLKIPKSKTFGFFGQGIYFADRIWKSALYTDHGRAQTFGKHGYLFLCEVLLGNIFKSEVNLPHLTMPPQPQHYQSVQGLGHWYPDPEWNESRNGCIWPMGNIKQNQSLSSFNTREVNEFIVYDAAQVRPKYLIKFEFTDGKFFHKFE